MTRTPAEATSSDPTSHTVMAQHSPVADTRLGLARRGRPATALAAAVFAIVVGRQRTLEILGPLTTFGLPPSRHCRLPGALAGSHRVPAGVRADRSDPHRSVCADPSTAPPPGSTPRRAMPAASICRASRCSPSTSQTLVRWSTSPRRPGEREHRHQHTLASDVQRPRHRRPRRGPPGVETHFFGTLAIIHAFAPVLAANGGGALLNVLCVLPVRPVRGQRSECRRQGGPGTRRLTRRRYRRELPSQPPTTQDELGTTACRHARPCYCAPSGPTITCAETCALPDWSSWSTGTSSVATAVKPRRLLDVLRERHETELAVVWRHLPLPEMHSHALLAAHAAEAAGRQGRFWQMHDRLLDDQRAVDPDALRAVASALGLDVERFAADAADPDIAARVQRDRDDAEAAALQSTPSFYLDEQLLLEPWPTLRGLVPQLLSTRRRGENSPDPGVTSAPHGQA